MTRKRQLIWILTAFFVVATLDQITKAIVMSLIEKDAAPKYDVFFHFTHQRNEGLVGGMFRDYRIVTIIAPLIATGILVYLFRHLDPASRIQSLAYGMVLGGAVGNLTDRAIHGSVTDFLQFNFYFIPFDFPWRYYPAFNVADSCICVGVALLVLTWNSQQPQTNAARTA